MNSFNNKNKILYNNEFGINIISLVVTVIVLLILAGVSIFMLVGSNGIIRQAVRVKEQTEIANEKEQIQLVYTERKISNLGDEIKADDLFTKLNNNKIDTESVYGNNESGFVIILKNKNIYEIDKNGEIEYKGTKITTSNTDNIMKERNKDEDSEFWKEEYRTKITKIEIKPYVTELQNVIKTWDISKKENTKGVMAYLVDTGTNEYELYIMTNGIVELSSDSSNLFDGFTSLKNIDIAYVNTENVVKMTSLFRNCENLENLDLTSFNTAKVKNMDNMFFNCKKLESIKLENFDTTNVVTMYALFFGCSSLKKLNLSNFNTSNVNTMYAMFYNCSSLKSLNLNNFSTNKVETMYCMFYNCSSLEYLNLESFNTDNVTEMRGIFGHCNSVKNVDLSSFNTSKVKNMSNMFVGCKSIEKLDISNFSNISSTSVVQMFFECENLKEIDLSGFTNYSITNTEEMLTGVKENAIIYVKNENVQAWLKSIKNNKTKVEIKNTF